MAAKIPQRWAHIVEQIPGDFGVAIVQREELVEVGCLGD